MISDAFPQDEEDKSDAATEAEFAAAFAEMRAWQAEELSRQHAPPSIVELQSQGFNPEPTCEASAAQCKSGDPDDPLGPWDFPTEVSERFWKGSVLSPFQAQAALGNYLTISIGTGEGPNAGSLMLRSDDCTDSSAKRTPHESDILAAWTGPDLIHGLGEEETPVQHSSEYRVSVANNSVSGGGTLPNGARFRVYGNGKDGVKFWETESLGPGRVPDKDEIKETENSD